MPEGPSIVIAREAISVFEGRKVLEVAGNAKIDLSRFKNQSLTEVKSWGKHLLLCFGQFTVRIHFLMFGSYTINEKKQGQLRLSLRFKGGFVNFYTCSVKIIEGTPDEVYDWTADVMNEKWSPRKAARKLKEIPDALVCDALLDQDIFAGVGNIIKNEVLFRIRVHPESRVGSLPARKSAQLIREARGYSFEFLEWKKKFVLKKHWLIYTKKTCPRDHSPVEKKSPGVKKRRSFFCPECQLLYD
jgi:endonuclease VIII